MTNNQNFSAQLPVLCPGLVIYRVAQKVSHYRESSLNRIKNRQPGYIFTNFDYEMSKRILYVRIKYSMYDLICDVISCCV